MIEPQPANDSRADASVDPPPQRAASMNRLERAAVICLAASCAVACAIVWNMPWPAGAANLQGILLLVSGLAGLLVLLVMTPVIRRHPRSAFAFLALVNLAVWIPGAAQARKDLPPVVSMWVNSPSGSFAPVADRSGAVWAVDLPEWDLGIHCIGGVAHVTVTAVELANGEAAPIEANLSTPQEDPSRLSVNAPVGQTLLDLPDKPVRRLASLRVPQSLAGRTIEGAVALSVDCPRRVPGGGFYPKRDSAGNTIRGEFATKSRIAHYPFAFTVPPALCFEAAQRQPSPFLGAWLLLALPSGLLLLDALRAALRNAKPPEGSAR